MRLWSWSKSSTLRNYLEGELITSECIHNSCQMVQMDWLKRVDFDQDAGREIRVKWQCLTHYCDAFLRRPVSTLDFPGKRQRSHLGFQPHFLDTSNRLVLSIKELQKPDCGAAAGPWIGVKSGKPQSRGRPEP